MSPSRMPCGSCDLDADDFAQRSRYIFFDSPPLIKTHTTTTTTMRKCAEHDERRDPLPQPVLAAWQLPSASEQESGHQHVWTNTPFDRLRFFFSFSFAFVELSWIAAPELPQLAPLSCAHNFFARN
eukprot:m.199907 g.199907  ORF g.199907 m.199907 type:complete len:126 (+) comp10661_c3_seq8:1894-2271(+)